jgi:hypothetical protein
MQIEKNISIPLSVDFVITRTSVDDIYEGGVESSICSDSYLSKRWAKIHEHSGGEFHPVKFYNAHPNIGIACIIAEGRVAARALLYYRNPNGEPTKFGPVYYNDVIFGRILHTKLNEMKVVPGNDGRWVTNAAFSVPGYEVDDGQFLCGVPFTDNLGPVRVRWNNATKNFDFAGEYDRLPGSIVLDAGRSHFGYISNTNLYLPSDGDY